ncbi:thiopeptide-type bacteriocin biosynthesis protein [Streptomyces polychromogenes]|uniref:thiopeptide-type bacteriocin biosynthesis protein n=1 Tax=Streptomyces polychromogenes TaxID=67342 RepID=UPI0031D9B922
MRARGPARPRVADRAGQGRVGGRATSGRRGRGNGVTARRGAGRGGRRGGHRRGGHRRGEGAGGSRRGARGAGGDPAQAARQRLALPEAVRQPLAAATGLGTRFAFDTYEREVERYGGSEGMRAAEAVFGTDSSSVARLLQAGEDGELALDRTDLAVSSVDDLLDSLGLTPDQRLAFCRGAGETSRDGGEEYRRRGHQLRQTLGRQDCPDTAVLRLLLAERRASLAPAADLLGALRREGLGGDGERRVLELLRRTREGLARAPVDRPPGAG